MLTKEKIEENKQRYLDLINSIKTEGVETQRFINWLIKSDFFTAPASTKYHANYEGGLCEHCLNVYDSLKKLVDTFAFGEYSDDSIKTVALLHDLAKVNFYEIYQRNVKTGDKDPRTGKDVWTQVEEYKTIAPEDRKFLFGNHEQTSEYIAHSFFPLTVEESVAILNHHGGKGFDSAQTDLSPIYNRYTLAVLLHLADMTATYVYEKIINNDK